MVRGKRGRGEMLRGEMWWGRLIAVVTYIVGEKHLGEKHGSGEVVTIVKAASA